MSGSARRRCPRGRRAAAALAAVALAAALAAARAGDAGATFEVRNRTPLRVFVYVDGVRAGWLGPYRRGRFRGLRRGYHRFYARTRFGNAAWGPRLLRVPGAWNLLPP